LIVLARLATGKLSTAGKPVQAKATAICMHHRFRFYSSISHIITYSVVFRLPPEDPTRVKQALEVLVLYFYCNCAVCIYFADRPIFEHSVSGVGNLPSHVKVYICY